MTLVARPVRVLAGVVRQSLLVRPPTQLGGSDPFFQDEVPLAQIRSGPYQSLLTKVAEQLK